MEFEERIENARRVLGKGVRILKRREPGTKKKTKPISSFVPKKTKGRRDMTRSEYQQCGKKTRYKTEEGARKYASHLSELRGYPIRVYQCPVCMGFHLTHKPDAKRPKRVNMPAMPGGTKRKGRGHDHHQR